MACDGRVVIVRVLPLETLCLQVSVVDERATCQEIDFHEFDEGLDRTLLIARRRPTCLWMEVEFRGQLQQRAVPDRLLLVIASSRDGLHVVEHQHPRHEAQRVEARDQPTEQRLLAHVVGEDHPRPAAVLQPTRQKVARHRRLLAERKVADLTPVNLEVFARQTLEAHRHIGDGLLV